MKIELNEITVRELTDGYADNDEEGVFGYGGKLDIRPPYQRNFIYGPKERDAVINTVTNNFPLNVMYWSVRKDGDFEVIDGQQRTISICQYVTGIFSFQKLYFRNLPDDKQEQILNYKLTVYQCTGKDSERLDWFRTINIAGKPLSDQELKNAVYAGSWVSDAKRYFSKTACVAYQIGQDYLNGTPIRQEYLETAIDWISDGKIEDYMGKHQRDKNAKPLWNYFQKVMDWVAATFTTKRKNIMRGVPWGFLYNKYKDETYDAKAIEAETAKLIADEEEVTSQKGIYPYILTRDEKYLALRTFPDPIKRRVYERQKGICPKCPKTKPKRWDIEDMEGDHITPWSKGGKTVETNCQMLCKDHNRRKSGQ